jgi:benzoylformate decarboxylase
VLPVSARSPCYAGYLPPSVTQVAARLADHDALLMVGGRGPRNTLYSDAQLKQKVAWLGHDAAALSPGNEFALARVCDLKAALAAIAASVRQQPGAATPARTALALPRRDDNVLHPTRAIARLLAHYRDAIWVDEAGLSTSDVRQWMKLKAGEYLINGSGGIGWAIGGSVGAALGQTRRQIVAVIGDGSALYASEALWSAEHHGAAMLTVILSNRRYATLNAAASKLAGGPLQSFTIEPPVIDFGGLATLYGWHYAKASTEAELTAIVKRLGKRLTRNTVLELKLDPSVTPVTASRHF